MPLNHLGIIMDGNRRWAKNLGLPSLEGHRKGYETVKTVGLHALSRGVKFMTVYAFSSENWKRSKEEVAFLLDLLQFALTKELDFYLKHEVRLRIIGDKKGFSPTIQEAMENAEEKTKHFTRGQFSLCVNYGGRNDIVHAVQQLITEGVPASEINEEVISSRLWTAGIPDPELVIRTSGEERLSGFLTWNSVYSELMFVKKNWPDFTTEDLDAALEEFEKRQRRFGV